MFLYNQQQFLRLKDKEKFIKRHYTSLNLFKMLDLYKVNIFYKLLDILIFGRFDSYLKNLNGVIHIGASDGYERDVYKNYKVKNVIWIEPDPFMFKKLLKNIKSYKNHKAYNYLMADTNNVKYKFNITSNNGQNSSIYEMEELKKMYPRDILKIKKKLLLKSLSFKKFVEKEKIDLKEYPVLVVDAEGAELKVLKGCGNLINTFRFIRVETSEFSLFKNYPLLYEISYYLRKFDFKELRRLETDQSNYYQKSFDILYAK
jgi:FkbM family methyltransferase